MEPNCETVLGPQRHSELTLVKNGDLLEVLVAYLRWKNWLRDVDHIKKFLETGEICTICQLSEADKNDLVQTAQRYYIESKLTKCTHTLV